MLSKNIRNQINLYLEIDDLYRFKKIFKSDIYYYLIHCDCVLSLLSCAVDNSYFEVIKYIFSLKNIVITTIPTHTDICVLTYKEGRDNLYMVDVCSRSSSEIIKFINSKGIKYDRRCIKELMCRNKIDILEDMRLQGFNLGLYCEVACRYGHLDTVKYLHDLWTKGLIHEDNEEFSYSRIQDYIREATIYGHPHIVEYLKSIE